MKLRPTRIRVFEMKINHSVCVVFCATVCAGFIACNNSIGDNTIKVVIPNGSQYSEQIDSVSLGLRGTMSNRVFYNNGNFNLNLKSVSEESLESSDKIGLKNTIISDPLARLYSDKYLSLISAFKNGKLVGVIALGNQEGWFMTPIYLDRKCKISGSFKEGRYTSVINLSLLKGWNKTYSIETEDYKEWTTVPPKGLEWRVQFDVN